MTERILASAVRTLNVESSAIVRMAECIDDQFISCVKLLLDCRGRIIVTGIGKSALVAQKIVSTLNSTGAPSTFLHAADAIHGDIGMLKSDDLVICLSNSGESPEIRALIPLIQRRKTPLVCITGNKQSYLGKASDICLYTPIEEEACPFNLAPTSSTTAQLAMGDAIAVALLEERGFSKDEFAANHPGGFIGKQLYLTVGELAKQNMVPRVLPDSPSVEIITEISSKRLGAAAVTEENGRLLGIITDGDIRRMLKKDEDFRKLVASEIMTENPKSLEYHVLAVQALKIMQEFSITQLPIVNDGRYLGMVHLHDIIREGIV